jgi:hypothetical protein
MHAYGSLCGMMQSFGMSFVKFILDSICSQLLYVHSIRIAPVDVFGYEFCPLLNTS